MTSIEKLSNMMIDFDQKYSDSLMEFISDFNQSINNIMGNIHITAIISLLIKKCIITDTEWGEYVEEIIATIFPNAIESLEHTRSMLLTMMDAERNSQNN